MTDKIIVFFKIVVDLKRNVTTDAGHELCAYLRFVGVTGDSIEEIDRYMNERTDDGAINWAEGDDVALSDVRTDLLNTGKSPNQNGIWHWSGRIFLDREARAKYVDV